MNINSFIPFEASEPATLAVADVTEVGKDKGDVSSLLWNDSLKLSYEQMMLKDEPLVTKATGVVALSCLSKSITWK